MRTYIKLINTWASSDNGGELWQGSALSINFAACKEASMLSLRSRLVKETALVQYSCSPCSPSTVLSSPCRIPECSSQQYSSYPELWCSLSCPLRCSYLSIPAQQTKQKLVANTPAVPVDGTNARLWKTHLFKHSTPLISYMWSMTFLTAI